jgi:NADH:ubiquinone oxidoreductase subunit 5 (subunit L)/multisubunit Na+/H+ antiporter MnhA subunit
MTDSVYHPLLNALYRNTNVQFWLLQIVGWFGLSLISFLSLNLWYNQQGTGYVAHTLVQSAIGCFGLLAATIIVSLFLER